jgi:8-oxo-dGTP pyrophosphatase MutT (NUDIX family)
MIYLYVTVIIPDQQNEIMKVVLLLQNTTAPLVFQTFSQRLQEERPLVRDEDVGDHFCCMFIPFVPSQKSVFVGHHIKSGLWMPPGGHIDIGETPEQTVLREIQEELHFKPNTIPTPYALTYVDITNRPDCTRHYDIWYLMECREEVAFDYEKREFHEAGWYSIGEAVQKSSRSMFTAVLQKLSLGVPRVMKGVSQA